MAFLLDDRGHLAPDWLVDLRVRADDLSRDRDWPALHEFTAQLRRDELMWAEKWGPYCAIAAREVGDPAARALLEEVIAAGFHQPDNFAGILETAFGGEPDWPDLLERMRANQPPPPLTITAWPEITPSAPLALFRLGDEGEATLRELVPKPHDSAWETAKDLLCWVSNRWRHANAHMEVDDAVLCLQRVDAGARFACPEYALVLSQALNALSIPARRIRLRQSGYHAGLGRGHVVCEAWIDDLGAWIALDAQNGLIWTDESGTALGVLELRAMLRQGAATPAAVGHTDKVFEQSKLDFWFSYFAHAGSSAGTFADGGYVPVFQRKHPGVATRLEREPQHMYPDLSEVDTGVCLADGALALQFTAAHPFATGFAVDGVACGAHWPIDSAPGEHEVTIQTMTPYGRLCPHTLRYEVARKVAI